MIRRYTRAFDSRINHLVSTWPKSLKPVFQFASLIGQPVFTATSLIGVATVGYISENFQLMSAAFICLLTLIISTLLKIVLHRKRPLTEYVEKMFFKTYSFPSGHSVGSLVSYGFVAYILSQIGTPIYLISAIVLMIIIAIIGISRVYLGAHFASDVVGGWLIGAIGLVVAIGVLQ